MALTNIALRATPIALLSRLRLPPLVERWLGYVPVSVMAAIVATSEMLTPGGRWLALTRNPYLLAAVPTALVYRFTRSFLGRHRRRGAGVPGLPLPARVDCAHARAPRSASRDTAPRKGPPWPASARSEPSATPARRERTSRRSPLRPTTSSPPELREDLLARDPHNVVALELPEGTLDPTRGGQPLRDRRRALALLARRRRAGADAEPAVYVARAALHHGRGREVARRGFVAAVDLEPFSAGVVLPHERTLPKAIDDRLNITRATAANLSQVFGMFADPDHVTDALMRQGDGRPPLATATDDDEVVSTHLGAHRPGRPRRRSREFMADEAASSSPTGTTATRRRSRTATSGARPRSTRRGRGARVRLGDDGAREHGRPGPRRMADAPDRRRARRRSIPTRSAPSLERALRAPRPAAGPPVSRARRGGSTPPAFIVSDARRRHEAGAPALRRRPRRRVSRGHLRGVARARRRDAAGARPRRRCSTSTPTVPPRSTGSRSRRTPHEALKAAGEHDVVFVLKPTRMDQVAAVAPRGRDDAAEVHLLLSEAAQRAAVQVARRT